MSGPQLPWRASGAVNYELRQIHYQDPLIPHSSLACTLCHYYIGPPFNTALQTGCRVHYLTFIDDDQSHGFLVLYEWFCRRQKNNQHALVPGSGSQVSRKNDAESPPRPDRCSGWGIQKIGPPNVPRLCKGERRDRKGMF
jgi:hypothetical protein